MFSPVIPLPIISKYRPENNPLELSPLLSPYNNDSMTNSRLMVPKTLTQVQSEKKIPKGMTENSPGFSGVKRSETRDNGIQEKLNFPSEAREWIAKQHSISHTLRGDFSPPF